MIQARANQEICDVRWFPALMVGIQDMVTNDNPGVGLYFDCSSLAKCGSSSSLPSRQISISSLSCTCKSIS